MTKIEIAVQNATGASIAYDAGADRVELCQALHATGGLTPSDATIRACVDVDIDVHVLIRPRPGGFCYTHDEINLMAEEARDAISCGAAGIVIGAALPDCSLDTAALEKLVAAAGGASVTLHRVFDTLTDREAALKTCAELGITRVLTSAGEPSAVDKPELLKALASASPGVEIMAGGGISPANVELLRGTGVHAIHASCSTIGPDTGPSGPGGGSQHTYITDRETVTALVTTVQTWKTRS